MIIARTSNTGSWLAQAALAALLVAALFLGCKLTTYDDLRSVTIAPADASIAIIATQQLSATATYADGSSRDVTAEATWTSSDPNVATVSSSGLATPAHSGTTTITASLRGHSGSTTLTVTNAQLQSIEVKTETPSIANGTTAQFNADGHFDDGSTQDITSQVTWDADSTVTISNDALSKGLATSTVLGAATSTITATLGTISGFTTLTVKAVALDSISLTPLTATIKVGKTQQFVATGTFSDGTTQVMTNEVAWTSSDTSIATINSSTGLATGKQASPTAVTITATSIELLGPKSGTAQLTVQACAGSYGGC